MRTGWCKDKEASDRRSFSSAQDKSNCGFGGNWRGGGYRKIDDGLSNTLYVYKSLAIICVVMAHCQYNNEIVYRISSLFGTLGVPIFYLVSGFFFQYHETTVKFWNKKIKTIIVPWLVWGIITYCFSTFLSNKNIQINDAINWLLGNGTWLYFVPMLLICFLIFRISEKKLYMLIVFILFLVSNILTVCRIIDTTEWVTKYQFVFNWCGFFEMGIFTRKNLDKLKNMKLTYTIKLLIITAWIICGMAYTEFTLPTYFTSIGLLYECLSIIAIYFIAEALKKRKLLRNIGKNTYPIFFIHMQFGIGIFNVIERILHIGNWEWLLLVVKPITIVWAIYCGIKIIQIIFEQLHIKGIVWIFGIKI